MKKNIYAVEIGTERGVEISRYFETIRAARNYVKYLKTLKYILSARILKGGQGGEETK